VHGDWRPPVGYITGAATQPEKVPRAGEDGQRPALLPSPLAITFSAMSRYLSSPRLPSSGARRGVRFVTLLTVVLALAACDMGFPGSEGEADIDRDTFVATYTDLRIAAMGWESQRLPADERDAVLERHGVTADDLREFVAVHGRNVPVMNEIWNDISANVQAAREEAIGGEEGSGEEGPPVAPVAGDDTTGGDG